MSNEKKENVTTYINIEDFLTLIVRGAENTLRESAVGVIENFVSIVETDVLKVAYDLGIADEYELLHSQDILTKKIAARILHRALRKLLLEPDDDNWSGAYILADLFDCHICAGDIAQVYVKGIVECSESEVRGRTVFGITENVKNSMAKDYIDRLYEKDSRLKVLRTVKKTFESVTMDKFTDDKGIYMCVDLRNRDSYMHEPVIAQSINIPFKKVYLNPYVVSENREGRIYLYSDIEYECTAAAELLIKSGYADIKVIENGNSRSK